MTKRSKPPRDLFGRFHRRGSLVKPPPVRNRLGQILSTEDREYRATEEFQRMVDRALETPHQTRQRLASEARAAEVKAEKQSRYARIRQRPEIYNANARDTDADLAQIEDERDIPKPSQVVRHDGGLEERIWMWRGPQSLQTAQALLLLLKTDGPSDMKGYLALGNGRGKNSNWIGTKFGTPAEVWRHSQTFMTSKSANVVAINQLPMKERDGSIWAEVKMTTQGRLSNETTKTPGIMAGKLGNGRKPKGHNSKARKSGTSTRKATGKKRKR